MKTNVPLKERRTCVCGRHSHRLSSWGEGEVVIQVTAIVYRHSYESSRTEKPVNLTLCPKCAEEAGMGKQSEMVDVELRLERWTKVLAEKAAEWVSYGWLMWEREDGYIPT